MAADNVEAARRIGRALAGDEVVEALADAGAEKRIRRIFADLAEPDFEVAMIGGENAPRAIEGRGFEGFRGAWAEWTEAFESFRVEPQELIDAGDVVVSFVRLIATTRLGAAPIEQNGAAVWRFRAGRLVRAEFHLDRATALRSAGLEPGTQSSQPKL